MRTSTLRWLILMIRILTSSSTNPVIFKEVGLALTNIGFVAVRDEEVYIQACF